MATAASLLTAGGALWLRARRVAGPRSARIVPVRSSIFLPTLLVAKRSKPKNPAPLLSGVYRGRNVVLTPVEPDKVRVSVAVEAETFPVARLNRLVAERFPGATLTLSDEALHLIAPHSDEPEILRLLLDCACDFAEAAQPAPVVAALHHGSGRVVHHTPHLPW